MLEQVDSVFGQKNSPKQWVCFEEVMFVLVSCMVLVSKRDITLLWTWCNIIERAAVKGMCTSPR